MYLSLRGRLRQGGLFLILLSLAFVSSPQSREAAQESAMRWDHVAFEISGLAHGAHKVSVTYLGDINYKGSTAALTQTVN